MILKKGHLYRFDYTHKEDYKDYGDYKGYVLTCPKEDGKALVSVLLPWLMYLVTITKILVFIYLMIGLLNRYQFRTLSN